MIKLYTIAVNRPDFIAYQQKTFKKFLAEEHEIIVVNDGRDGMERFIPAKCDELGLRCVTVEQPRRDTANYAHARSIEWVYEKYIRHDEDISVLLDGDMFLGGRFSIREWMKDADLSGIGQGREHVVYLWPGLVFLNMPNLPDKEKLSFWPDVVDGQRVDVGGHSYEYIRDHPGVRVKWIYRDLNDRGCFPTREEFEEARKYGAEVALKFLHYRCGTNWDHQTPTHHIEKTKLVFGVLDKLLAGEQ